MTKINLLYVFLLFSCSLTFKNESNKTLKLKDVLDGFESTSIDDINYVKITTYTNGIQPGFFKNNLTSTDLADKKAIYDFIVNTPIEEVDSSEGRIYGGSSYNYFISKKNDYFAINTTQSYFSIDNKYYKLYDDCYLKNGVSTNSIITNSNEIEIYENDIQLYEGQNIFFNMEFEVNIIENLVKSEYKIVTDFGDCFLYGDSTFSFISPNEIIYECKIVNGNNFAAILNSIS